MNIKSFFKPISISLRLSRSDSCNISGYIYHFKGECLGELNFIKPSKLRPYHIHIVFEDMEFNFVMKSGFVSYHNSELGHVAITLKPFTEQAVLMIDKYHFNHSATE